MNTAFSRLVLTGATGGIGEAIASALDREGYSLLLTGRSEQKLSGLKNTLAGHGHKMLRADLTTPEGLATLAAAAREFNASGLINCAGINMLAMLGDSCDDQIAKILSTNLHAPINVCKSLLPLLQQQKDAVIVNVGSILGSIGYAGSSIYCASKFGLRGFTESLRRELSQTNVRVIYLAPRATDTSLNTEPMRQMNRELGSTVDDPEDVAQALVRMLKRGKSANRNLGWPESFFVTLNNLAPRLVDKALSRQFATIKRYCDLGNASKSVSRPGGTQ